MPAPGSGRPLSEAELALLRDIAARKIVGPVASSPERDRLRKLGLIEGREMGWRDGKRAWVVSAAGEVVLAERIAA